MQSLPSDPSSLFVYGMGTLTVDNSRTPFGLPSHIVRHVDLGFDSDNIFAFIG